MADRLSPVLDQLYLKMDGGRRAILELVEKTEMVVNHLNHEGEDLYRILTDLERSYENFLRMAYLFKVQVP